MNKWIRPALRHLFVSGMSASHPQDEIRCTAAMRDPMSLWLSDVVLITNVIVAQCLVTCDVDCGYTMVWIVLVEVLGVLLTLLVVASLEHSALSCNLASHGSVLAQLSFNNRLRRPRSDRARMYVWYRRIPEKCWHHATAPCWQRLPTAAH